MSPSHLSRCLLAASCMAVAATVGLSCGGADKPNDAPLEIEEQLGLSVSGTGSVERQTRVEGRIRDCMRAQGFEYTPVDPFARPAGGDGKGTDER